MGSCFETFTLEDEDLETSVDFKTCNSGLPFSIPVRLRSILIATDLSAASRQALRHAITLARYFDAKLYIVHVISSLGLTMAGPDATAMASVLARRDVSFLERELIFQGDLRAIRHHVIVREGDIWEEVEDVVRREHIDLLVIGTHSRSGFLKLVLGSVAEKIFRGALSPVVTVGPNSPPEPDLPLMACPGPLMYPTDFSPASLAALPYAISVANHFKARLALVHLLFPVPRADEPRWYTAADVVRMQKEAEEAAMEKLLSLVADVELDQKPLPIVASGEISEGILKIAHGLHVSSIIMGLRSKQPEIASHTPWSTAYKVACTAECPVLTVRVR